VLNFSDRSRRKCTGVARRAMLQAGAFGFGGWTLTDLLKAEAGSGIRGSSKSIINIHLDGGPPHLDTIDPKPEAPVEIRGEFDSIETRLPGLRISELMPKVASIADRFVFIRSLVGSAGAHDAFQCQSGYAVKDLQSIGGRPAVGCVLSKLLGSSADTAPTFIDLMQGDRSFGRVPGPGFSVRPVSRFGRISPKCSGGNWKPA